MIEIIQRPPNGWDVQRQIDYLAHVVEGLYVNPAEMLRREISKSTQIYVLHDDSGLPVGFFCIGIGGVVGFPDGPRRLAYLGLSCLIPSRRSSGASLALYRYVFRQLAVMQQESGESLQLWGTTASPSVYRILSRIARRVVPKASGECLESDAQLLRTVAQQAGYASYLDENVPFLLIALMEGLYTGNADPVQLRDLEYLSPIFRDSGLQAIRGDRILFCASL